MTLKHIAEGGSFDLVQAIRLLAAKVDALTGENPALSTMDAADAGATLDEASAGGASAAGSAKKLAGKKKGAFVVPEGLAEGAATIEGGE
jgi:hypothetical protein